MWFLNNNFSHIYIDGKGSTAKKLAKYKNAIEFQNVFSLLCNEALEAMPGFDGLPETVSERVLKESILWHGGFFLFKKNGGDLGLPGMPTGSFTLYGDPVAANVFGRNGFTEEIKLYIPQGADTTVREKAGGGTAPEDGTGVWVRANHLVFPFINYVIEYADKVADSLRTLDIVRSNLKRPYIVSAEESIINTVKAFFNSRENNEEFIISSGVFPADKIKLLPFETTSDSIRDVTMLIEWYLAQFHQIIGVNAPMTVDKKAEVTTAELNSHQGVETLHVQMIEDTLQRDIDFANEKLGLDITIKAPEVETTEMSENGEEGQDNADNSNEEIQ